jgi:hypothetical protein
METEKRWSRNLKSRELETQSAGATRHTVRALDLSDIRKEYAQQMEYLVKVHDGSRGEW